MKKFVLLALAGAFAVAAPALADTTATDKAADLASDHAAIAKDHADIAGQDANMAANRMQKAKAKMTDDPVSQAAASVKLGANHVMKGVKSDVELPADKKIKNDDAATPVTK